jgi:hypothetical protein
MFPVYFKLGLEHILNINAYDHILFLVALCAMYAATEWKKILILVTAFTIGHSITLALSSLGVITLNPDLVEILIPVTILITALGNLFVNSKPKPFWNHNYFFALFFGFVHGMGFSNYFKALLGHEANIITPLLGFNLGVESGQLCIVLIIMVLNYIATGIMNVKQQDWKIVVSILAAILSAYMIWLKIK